MGGLKIALDATYSIGQNLSGVGVYSRELLAALARLSQARECEATWLWCYRLKPWWRTRGAVLPPHCLRRPLLEHWIPSCRLFHGLNQRLPTHVGQRRARRPMVATFHDVFVMTRQYSDDAFRRRFTAQARHAASAADAIIAVSAYTAAQVSAELGVPSSRLRVVPHGIRAMQIPQGTAREPMILSVGAIQKRKNTLGLVRAFERLPAGWKLVLAGAPSGYEAAPILDAIAQSPRAADIELAGWVSDAQLDALYARASIFAFPSLDEGFGIPVLEAMAAGTPVLASNTSSLPEVCGEAALLVDPSRDEALEHGLRTLIDDTALRDRLSAAGRRRAAGFTWDRAARETWAVYADLVGG